MSEINKFCRFNLPLKIRKIFQSIAVVETQTPIIFTANIQPIAMASAFTGGGVNAVVSGWGGIVTGGPAPNHLQVMTTTTLTNSDCRSRHDAFHATLIFDHKICTFARAGKGICQGLWKLKRLFSVFHFIFIQKEILVSSFEDKKL